jgi:hypothetical protein
MRHQQEVIAGLHAAGQTRLTRISGYTIQGKGNIQANYTAMVEGQNVGTSETIRSDLPSEASPFLLYPEFFSRYGDYLLKHMRGQLERISSATIEIDGIPRTVERSIVNDEDLGEITIWWSEYQDGS